MNTYKIFIQALETIHINEIAKYLALDVATLNRWLKLKRAPAQFEIDIKRLLKIPVDLNELSFKDKDQFYTNTTTAKYCLDVLEHKLKEIGVKAFDYTFIEPSAGDGAFYNQLPINKIGIDIEPNAIGIVQHDYLEWLPSTINNIVVGNPPFGLRGNLALRFINHSFKFADVVAFILPPIFNSKGKGSCMKRVKGYKLIHTEDIDTSFYYPNKTNVKVNCIFQIWSKIGKSIIKYEDCSEYVKMYSLSDGGTPQSTRNKKMHDKCDYYLPSTCFGKETIRLYESFKSLPNSRGIGLKLLKDKEKISYIIETTDWSEIAFASTNGAYNLRFDLITKIIINKL